MREPNWSGSDPNPFMPASFTHATPRIHWAVLLFWPSARTSRCANTCLTYRNSSIRDGAKEHYTAQQRAFKNHRSKADFNFIPIKILLNNYIFITSAPLGYFKILIEIKNTKWKNIIEAPPPKKTILSHCLSVFILPVGLVCIHVCDLWTATSVWQAWPVQEPQR